MPCEPDELFGENHTRHVAQAQECRMRNTLELCLDCVVNFFLSMAVNIAPERRDSVEIAPAMDVDQIMAFGAIDHTGFFAHPFLHLSKRMPQVGVIRLF